MSELVTMPKLGFDMAEGTLVRWVKKQGDSIAKGQVLAEIETDKATVEVESSASGLVAAQLVDEGAVVPVGQLIAVIAAPGEQVNVDALRAQSAAPPASEAMRGAAPAPPAPTPEPARSEPAVPPNADGHAGELLASPIARKMASEAGIDIRLVPGTGPNGRIVKRDVEAFVQRGPTPLAGESSFPSKIPALFRDREPRADREIPRTRLRQAIGRHMSESKQAAPHFSVTVEVDMAATMGLRAQLNALVAEGEKISVNDFIVRAAALGLREFPNLNATIRGEALIQRGRINVGLAVAVEGGLLTPVIHDADFKSLAQIAVEARALVGRARQGKIKPGDVEGGTFTLSNLGMFDVTEFVAIINPPEAAILAVGTVRQAPVVTDGLLAVGSRMAATVSADHRVTDGAEVARYLGAVRRFLEEPLRLLI